uniref:Uncharacterized protein n=1 Tax=viral metagenome TaxID=1070528 RepID=A0A6H1ZJ74_9ZZZZ
MDFYWVKALALVFVMLIVCKRAVAGPQKLFARMSAALLAIGVVMLALVSFGASGDVAATVLISGMLVVLAMVVADCAHVVRSKLALKKAR